MTWLNYIDSKIFEIEEQQLLLCCEAALKCCYCTFSGPLGL